MTTRRRWVPSSISTVKVGREYVCLSEEGLAVENALAIKHHQRRTAAAPPAATASMETISRRKGRTKSLRNSDLWNQKAFDTPKCMDDAEQDSYTSSLIDSAIDEVKLPIYWSDFCPDAERVRAVEIEDDDDDDDRSYGTNSYVAKYYHVKSIYSKFNKSIEHRGKNHDQIHLLFDNQSNPSFRNNQKELGLSQSFETQETQLEEASETSLCTTDDDEEICPLHDSSVESCRTESGSIHGKLKKRVRWLDVEYPGSEIVTHVYTLDYSLEPSYTCRVVFLLLMDRGPHSSEGNYEFLHCEFRHDDRLRVSDALPQITRLVLGTPEIPSERVVASESYKPFRPFTHLYLDGKELINSLALQDYCLEDGQSTLVALREPLSAEKWTDTSMHIGKQRRDELLRQSSLLLADKSLRRGIRKARIAGRSLQILHGTKGMMDEKRRRAHEAENGNKLFDGDDTEDSDTDVDLNINTDAGHDEFTGWCAFDSLTRNSFDDDDWNDASFTVDFF
jgi:hypothetical protein